jgi:hypothetical protein
LATSMPALFEHQERLFAGTRLALPPEILVAIKATQASRLVLLTKHRAPARLQAYHAFIGTGMLEGLGFYVDRQKPIRSFDTSELARGYIAPYVYVQVSLVDLATSEVVRNELVMATATVSAADGKTGMDPWDAMPAERKVAWLRDTLAHEVSRVVPTLVANAPPAR